MPALGSCPGLIKEVKVKRIAHVSLNFFVWKGAADFSFNLRPYRDVENTAAALPFLICGRIGEAASTIILRKKERQEIAAREISILCAVARVQDIAGIVETALVLPKPRRYKKARVSKPRGYQNSAEPVVLGKGRTSRMLLMPVRYMIRRSKPRPKPAWCVPP